MYVFDKDSSGNEYFGWSVGRSAGRLTEQRIKSYRVTLRKIQSERFSFQLYNSKLAGIIQLN